MNSVGGAGSRNAVNDDLVPDLILPEASSCGYVGSDGFLNCRAVGLEDRACWGVVFGNKAYVVVGSELYCCHKRFLNSRVDGIAYGKVVGSVRECCAISLNDNRTVAFGQNKWSRFLGLRGGRYGVGGCSGSSLNPGSGRKRCYGSSEWGRGCCFGGWGLGFQAFDVVCKRNNLIFELFGVCNMAVLNN